MKFEALPVALVALTTCFTGLVSACAHEQAPVAKTAKPASEVNSAPPAADSSTTNKQLDARVQPACGSAKQCFADGMAAKKQGQESKALRLFTDACGQGELRGCFAQGVLLPDSEDAKALQLFVRVCHEGKDTDDKGLRTVACYNAGNMLFSRDKAQASEMFEVACLGPKKLPPACKGGAVAALDTGNFDRARKLAEAGCNDELTETCNVLGALYLKGQGVEQDVSKALGYFQRACRGGDQDACSNRDAVNKAMTPEEVPRANVRMEDVTVNGQHAKDVVCRMQSGGLLGSLVGPTAVVGALAKKRLALKRCTKGKATRIHFRMSGARLVAVPVDGLTPATNACLARVLRTVASKGDGECAMTLLF